jgi:(1->4)-alpha-D-glucan 1-alpha-D-glucosylmutase
MEMGSTALRVPLATYRVQLGPHLSFEQITGLLSYFHDLGISHLYLSPCLRAAAGSTHGYDVVDPTEVNPELGGLEGFDRLCAAAAALGLGLVIDIVPNHMAALGRQNPWWWDVLAKGRASAYAGFFDINWNPSDPRLRGKMLLPVLGDDVERCLESRQIQIRRRGSEFFLSYFEHELPVCSGSLLGLPHSDLIVAGSDDLENSAAAALDAAIEAINADPVRLNAILDQQHYRLAFWRQANRDLNYRRFFDVHQLVGICVEKDDVFAATHALVLRWGVEGRIAGLRIDHPDGLRDPTAYLQRLRTAVPRAWIVVEKILERGELLASEWPVAGTTGYDFLNMVNGLFVDPSGERVLSDFYGEFTGRPTDYRDVMREKKLLALEGLFRSELSHLEYILGEIWLRRPVSDGARPPEVRRALKEIIGCFPVYRTYIRPDTGMISARDRAIVQEALDAARRRPEIHPGAWQLIEDLLLLRQTGRSENEFVWRLQQLTGPVMAKGVEDTAFYCFNRLIGLNEVGGDPGSFGTSLNDFHSFCSRIHSQWPQTMLASATHDTKRGEDTRLRIGLLSEIPERWIDAVRRWSRMNDSFRRNHCPDRNTEYFLYQTLAGAWPIGSARLVPVMLKAVREAKVHTSWTDPSPAFEEGLSRFIEGIMGHPEFTSDLSAFLAPLSWPAVVSSLSQTLIKCTAPGVPDIYQGAELWDLSLVDPDNRRPVDFQRRRQLLAEAHRLPCAEILKRHAEGLPKIFLLQRVLAIRRRHAEAFGPKGSYLPITAEEELASHLVAFMRGEKAITLAPRLAVGLGDDWQGAAVELPPGVWENAISGERFRGGTQKLSRLLKQFPVALLVRQGGKP